MGAWVRGHASYTLVRLLTRLHACTVTNIVTSEELRHLAVMMRRLDDGTTDRISRARNSRRKARRLNQAARRRGEQ